MGNNKNYIGEDKARGLYLDHHSDVHFQSTKHYALWRKGNDVGVMGIGLLGLSGKVEVM